MFACKTQDEIKTTKAIGYILRCQFSCELRPSHDSFTPKAFSAFQNVPILSQYITQYLRGDDRRQQSRDDLRDSSNQLYDLLADIQNFVNHFKLTGEISLIKLVVSATSAGVSKS